MIKIKKYTSEEIKELKSEIYNQLEILKENTDDEETIERINHFSSTLSNTYKSKRKETRNLKKLNKKISFYQRFKNALQSDINIDPGRLMG